MYLLAIVGIVNSVISLYYYARVVRAMFIARGQTGALPWRSMPSRATPRRRLFRRAAFLARLAARLATGRVRPRPFILSHLVTSRCNFLCAQCLWKDNQGPELGLGEIRALYRQAHKCGFIANYLWGGEPLIRPDIGEILRASRASGLLTLVNTNAWFLGQKLDEVASQVDAFIVSLDHPRAEVHDAMRGVPGSHARVLAALDLLRSRYPGVKVAVNTLVLRRNVRELGEMLALWKARGLHGYMNFIERDLLRSGMHDEGRNADLDLLPAERRTAAAFLLGRQVAGDPLLNTAAYYTGFAAGKRGYVCHFPKIFLEVYADGSVVDCTDLDHPVGNVRRERLGEILERPRIRGMIRDGERWCCVHNNADRIDTSRLWELRPDAVLSLVRFALSGG
jgi:MoaA/NifB/PqqE/SkfB family radical SAM enzyme